MSKRFVRNIRDTKLTGKKKEPLYTNSQNDILSDGEDVYIRNQKEYHCLTDNIKKITVPEGNDTIKIIRTDKNTIEIVGNKQDIPDIPDIPDPLKLFSDSENLIVEKIKENEFKLLLDLSEYATKSDLEKIEIPDVTEFVTNEKMKEEITKAIGNIDLSDYATKTYVNTEIGKITIPDISEFLTETEIQNLIDTGISNIDLSNYSTKQEITQAIEQAINNIDLSNYYTKEEVETEIQNAISQIEIPEQKRIRSNNSGYLEVKEEKNSVLLIPKINPKINSFYISYNPEIPELYDLNTDYFSCQFDTEGKEILFQLPYLSNPIIFTLDVANTDSSESKKLIIKDYAGKQITIEVNKRGEPNFARRFKISVDSGGIYSTELNKYQDYLL